MAVLSATDKSFTSTMRGAANTMGDLDSSSEKTRSSLLKIATTAVAFKAVDIATNSLVSSLDGAINRYDTMNKFPRVMEQIGFSTEESTTSIERLSAGIDGLPTSLDGITASTQSIALLTGDLSSATETALALNNAFLASGASTSDAERGLTQYTQMLSKGKVDMQSWYTLQETMGYALKETAIQLGITSGSTNELYSALQSGSITFDQFNSAMIECSTRAGGFAEVAKTASEGIGTSLQNLQTAVVKNVTNIIDATDQMLADNGWGTLAGNIDGAKGVINTAGSAIASSIGTVGTVVKELSPVLITGASGWVAYEAAMKIQSTVKKATEAVAKAKTTFEEMQKATKLAGDSISFAAAASKASEKATKAATIAENLNVKAKAAAEKAAKAKMAADELAKKAVEARTKAESAGNLSTSLNAKADSAAAAAASASANATNLDTAAKGKKVAATRAATVAQAAETAAEEMNNVALTTNSALVAFKTTLMGGLAAGEGVATSATLAFNAALKANPIGVTVVAITALAAGMALLASKFSPTVKAIKEFKNEIEKVTDSADDLSSSIETNIKSRKDSISSIEAEGAAAKDLAKKIETLSTKDLENASNKQVLLSYIDSLNDSVEGLGLAYDEETKSLNMGTDAIRDRIEAYTAQTKAQAAADAYAEVLTEQIKLESELNAVQEKRNYAVDDNTSKVLTLAGVFNSSLRPATTAVVDANDELKASEEELIEQQGNLATQAEYLEGVISESAAAQAAAVSEGAQSQITSWDDLSASQTEALEEMSSTFNSYADLATDLFNKISTESEQSIDDMIANLQHNQEAMANWATNMDTLAHAGIDEGLLEQLRTAGPESAALVQELVNGMENGKLDTLSTLFGQNTQAAMDAMNTVFDTSNVPDNASAFMTRTGESIQSTIDSAFPAIGASAPECLAEGVQTGTPLTTEAIQALVSEAQAAVTGADFVTPTQKWGLDMFDSIIASGASVSAAVDSVSEDAKTAAANADFTTPTQKWASDMVSGTAINSGSVVDATTGLGTDASDGYAKGWESGTGAITGAIAGVITAGIDTAAATQNSNSPSVVYQGLGTDAIDGYILGLEGGQGVLSAAMTSTMQVAIDAAETALSSGLDSAVSSAGTSFNQLEPLAATGMSGMNTSIKAGTTIAKTAFNQIPTFAKTSMSTMNTAINAGMTTSNKTIQTKMKSNETVTKTGMTAMQTATVAGMNLITSAITSGMNAANSRVASGNASMVAKVQSLQSSFYASGVYASQGLANGINARAGTAIAAAQSVANRVASIMASALQERSPSKVTRKIGAYASEGLAIGLLEELSYVEKVSKLIANTVSDAINPDMGSISNRLAYAGDFSYTAEVDVNHNYSTKSENALVAAINELKKAITEENREYTFNIITEAEGREVARATATYMQDELNKLQRMKKLLAGEGN